MRVQSSTKALCGCVCTPLRISWRVSHVAARRVPTLPRRHHPRVDSTTAMCVPPHIARARVSVPSRQQARTHSPRNAHLPARAPTRARSRRFRLVFADSATVASISPPAGEPAETFDRSATSASSTTLPPAPPKRAAAPAPGDPVPDSPKSVDATPSDPCPRIPAQHEATANATAVVANSFELRPRWCANCSHCFFATSSRTSWFCSGECLYSYSVQCWEVQEQQQAAAHAQQGVVDVDAGSHGPQAVVRPRPDYAGFSNFRST